MNEARIRDLVDGILASATELDTLVPKAPPVPSRVVVRVKPGDDVAAAYRQLQTDGGGTLLAQPGKYWVSLGGVARQNITPLVTITTDNGVDLPADGLRITREHLPGLADFRAPGSGSTFTATAARNLAFVNVAFGPVSNVGATLVNLGSDTAMTPEAQSSDVLFDRVLMFGQPERGQRRGITAHASRGIVRGCAFHDFVEPGHDSQCIGAWNGGQNWLIENSLLEGGGENLMLGGGVSKNVEMNPRAWRVRRCTIRKDLKWKDWPTYASLNIKALVEIKNCFGFDLDGCLLEHAWAKNWPAGVGIMIKCAAQGDAPWTLTADVNVMRSVILGTDQPFGIVGYGDDKQPTQRMRNVHILHVLAITTGARGLRAANPPDGLVVDHLTMLGQSSSFFDFWFDQQQPKGTRLDWTNSVLGEGAYGIKGDSGGAGYAALANAFETVQFAGNLIVGTNARTYPRNVKISPVHLAAALQRYELTSAIQVATTDGTQPGVHLEQLREVGVPDYVT